ncbi:hypothetical protein N7456_000547 [Penicillium angulare]|uniref:Uncharacterized protein n=1 Tax=Penicillium angulare TaxID=116970 RepID=A0A9W9GCD1_9EURO|nr:hypothetical protein N7456_000547 [Penicillium angulare]
MFQSMSGNCLWSQLDREYGIGLLVESTKRSILTGELRLFNAPGPWAQTGETKNLSRKLKDDIFMMRSFVFQQSLLVTSQYCNTLMLTMTPTTDVITWRFGGFKIFQP